MNTISSLETTDLPAAYHIEQRAHAFPWSEKTFASNQGERYLNFQLTQNGKMAAFAITQVVLDEATLFNIAVILDYQRQGLGRALLEHLIDELEKRGVATLWLEVRASNAAAIARDESLGFNQAQLFAAITTSLHGRSRRRHHHGVANQYVRQGGRTKWDWIFFDADETLFTFCSIHRPAADVLISVTFTAEDFQDYQAVTKATVGGLSKRRDHFITASARAF